jgi:NADH:ubiquinone oxidoreductase subunit 2 (subunit N)
MYKHGFYYFVISFVYFIVVNVLNLYSGGIDLFQNTCFLSGYYIVNYKTQLIKIVMFIIWGSIVSNIGSARVFAKYGKVIDSDLMLLNFAGLASSLVLVSTNDLWLMVIVLDGLGLLLYISAITTRSYGATSAAVQYFIFGALSSGVIM